MTDHSGQTAKPRRSWGRIALVAALVLSLIGNAVAVGAWVRFREVRAEILGPGGEAALLPADLREEMRGALRAEARRLLPLLRDVVRARAATVAAATARPYDRATTEAAMEEFRRGVDDLLAEVQLVMLDRLDRIATEE
jgi:uncharacterized membrane protein